MIETTKRGPVRPSCTCTKGLRPLDSNSGYFLIMINQLGSRCRLEKTLKSVLVTLCFWPGGEAANPDALHPGKARE